MKTIDTNKLAAVVGGVRPGPNGEGCTQGPRKPGTPGMPGGQPPFQIPGENQPMQ